MAGSTKKKRWRYRCYALFGSLALVFVIGEVGIRILLYSGSRSAPESKEDQVPAPKAAQAPEKETGPLAKQAPSKQAPGPPARKPVDPSLPVFKGMLELGRKNVRGVHKGVFFRTNSQRLRGPEYRRWPRKNVFRIAIAGDSVTMGEGVEEEMTYSARLAEFFELPDSDDRIEVLNVGLSGSNIPFAIARLKHVVRHYHPDLIVYGFTINDIEGPRYEKLTDGTDQLAKVQSSTWFVESPSWLVRVVGWFWYTSRLQNLGNRNWYAEELDFNYFDNPSALEDWRQALREFDELAESEGICALVLIHTHLNALGSEHPYLPIYDLVEREANSLGLPAVPTYDKYFKGRTPRDLWVGIFDPHPNAEGHEIFAQALANGLAQLPAECFQPARKAF